MWITMLITMWITFSGELSTFYPQSYSQNWEMKGVEIKKLN